MQCLELVDLTELIEMTELPKNTSVPAPPIDHPRLNGLMGINKPQKKNRKTCRFTLDLFKPDDKKFPEFNYAKLLKKEKVCVIILKP